MRHAIALMLFLTLLQGALAYAALGGAPSDIGGTQATQTSAAAPVITANFSPSRVRRSGRVGPRQLTANTLPAVSLYSRTTVPLSRVLLSLIHI